MADFLGVKSGSTFYDVKDVTARNGLADKVDKVEGKGLSTNDYTDADAAIVAGVTTALNGKVDKVEGKALSTNDYTDADAAIVAGVTSALAKKVDTSSVGANGGVASLDANGHIPTSQLPASVDEIKEYNSLSDFPATGEADKIYVAKDTNLTYRWGGTEYVEISPSLALGETSSTAYAGDKGKANADNIATIQGLIPATATTSNKLATAADIPVITGKADKVSGATSGNFAGLDANGNLTDSGSKASDFLTSSDISGKQDKTLETAITVDGVSQTTVEGALGAINTLTGGNKTDIGTINGLIPSGATTSNKLATASDVSAKYDTGDTAETTLDNGDYFPFYDTSATGKRKVTFANLKVAIVGKEGQTISVSSSSVTLDDSHLTAQVTVTGAETAIHAVSDTPTVVTTSVSGSTITISNVNQTIGSASISVYAEESSEYSISNIITIDVSAVFSRDITIYSAANDTVSFTDSTGAKTVTTNSNGVGTASIVCNNGASITFTSSVAKNPSNLSQAYSKSIVLDENTSTVYVMPNDNVLYWYGYKSSNLEDISTANGWTNTTFVAPTYNTNSIRLSSSAGKLSGVGNKNAITGISKLCTIYKGVTAAGAGASAHYGVVASNTSKATNGASQYSTFTENVVAYKEIQATNDYVFVACESGRVSDIYALWYE